MLTLYEIADQYREILALTTQVDDTNDPETLRQTLHDTLESLGLDHLFEEKSLAIACFIRELEGEYLAVKNTEESIRLRRKQLEKKIDWIRDYLQVQMLRVGKTEIRDNRVICKLRKTPPRIVVDDESAIPEQFKEVETLVHLRKNRMQEALRSGVESIPGIHLETGFALTHLVTHISAAPCLSS